MNNEKDERNDMKPTQLQASYRGLPFWAWNTVLDSDRIRSQVDDFAEMGFGGFVIHSRNGLAAEYLGEEYLEAVRLAVACAKEKGMKVWIYDEDRWPSGCAGGRVTVERRFRQKSVLFTKSRRECVSEEAGKREGKPYLLAAYAVSVNREGRLTACGQTDEAHANLFAYVLTAEDSPRFNGQAYVDTMNPAAIARFIDLTYEVYRRALGDDFGDTVEAFFTDEPQVIRLPLPAFSEFELFGDTGIPWTEDFPDSFSAEYGESPIPRLPELFWDRSDGDVSFRYRYNEHIARRFRDAYSRQLGAWCRAHGVLLTGHFLNEDSLALQSASVRDVMRCYADEDIPGIDILRGSFEPITALQCASVAHRQGKRRVSSELYGVTGWTADFRDYIFQGCWQAALGVNVRVPHLSWTSMKGEGKRDYPATFGYQSPWHRDYRLIEDGFARLNHALSEGEPIVRIGVIHPIESYWLLCGANDRTGQLRHARNAAFRALCEWLLFDGFSFDLINEALLPESFREENGRTRVWQMRYDVVVVPDCLTLRESTIKFLERMRGSGVRVVFAGSVPVLVNAKTSGLAAALAAGCETIGMTEEALLRALEPYRSFDLFASDGSHSRKHICCERKSGEERIFFLSPAKPIEDKADTRSERYLFRIPGDYSAIRYDVWSGEERAADLFYADGYTWIRLNLYAYDTVLLRLREGRAEERREVPNAPRRCVPIPVAELVGVVRAEPNVLLLDMAEYSLDGRDYRGKTEILRIDGVFRAHFGLPPVTGKNAKQPWCIRDDRGYAVTLRYRFDSEIEATVLLGAERLESVCLNGVSVPLEAVGWYVDRDIRTYRLPPLRKGENVLTVVMKLGKINGLEPTYLLGDFDVRLRGTAATLLPPSREIGFGSVTAQGLPFYGGNLTYRMRIETPSGRLSVSANAYAGALVKARLDGEPIGNILLPPYRASAGVTAGEHILELECVGNRNDTFGSLHCGVKDDYYGPMHWHKTGDEFSREYRLSEFGILKAPSVCCEAIDMKTILGTAGKRYVNGDGSVLSFYEGKYEADFSELCGILQADGYDLYSGFRENGNRFATYTKGNELFHLSWLKAERRLRTVTSATAAGNLPVRTEACGEKQTAVYQLRLPISEANKAANGMGYVIGLSDGSFLVWDGGYAEQAEQLYRLLTQLNGGSDGIVIRAWALTHGHGDHIDCIERFAKDYAGKVTVERLLVARVAQTDVTDRTLHRIIPGIASRLGALICDVHTGMKFNFCNLALEILFSPDELFIDGKQTDFNNTGFVGRLFDDRDGILFLGDVMAEVTDRLTAIWGDTLRTNQCQMAHHGVGNSSLEFYESLNLRTLWYPCGHALYDWTKLFYDNIERNGSVRRALAESGKYEILLHDETIYKKIWGNSAAAEAFPLQDR